MDHGCSGSRKTEIFIFLTLNFTMNCNEHLHNVELNLVADTEYYYL